MAWYSNLFGRKQQPPQQQPQPPLPDRSEKQLPRGGGYLLSAPSKFWSVISAQLVNGEIAPDPYNIRDLSRIILWSIPELAATADMHARIIGFPEVETKDEAFRKDWEAFAREFTWKGEQYFAYDSFTGLPGYIYALALQTMTTGQSFTSLVDRDGRPLQKQNQQIGFARLHDSCRFFLTMSEPDRYMLNYEHGGQLYMDLKESLSMMPTRFRTDAQYPAWGVPLLYGTERMATAALIAEEAHNEHSSRVKNPSSILAGSFEPSINGSEMDQIGLMSQLSREAEAKAARMQTNYEEHFSRRKTTGQPFQAIEMFTGGKMSFEEHVIGKDIKPTGKYSEDVMAIVARAVIGAWGVPDFVGIQTMNSGGIGTDQHRQMTSRMESFGVGCRKMLEPHLLWLMSNYFLRSSKRIPDFKFEWEGLDISNEKGEAEVAKIWAEAQKLNVETAQLIADGAGPSAANDWLLKNDMDYKFGTFIPKI